MIRIGNAQGFWGDQPNAPKELSEHVDYLTLDYLAEVSLSIMAIQKEKDPTLGYAKDFLEVVQSLEEFDCKIITNGGGLNPKGCAKKIQEMGSRKTLGVVYGDDVSKHLNKKNLVTANAYIGAKPLVNALKQGADIVLTGRVADPSLTVAACVSHFNWKWDDYDKLASATIAGHLIECGTQVTGGFSTNWLDIPNPANMGFPIVEMDENGTFIITKPKNTGGKVSVETVKEQLLYEISDPDNYLSPDVTVSFLSLRVEEIEENKIQITGAKGGPPPSSYKVSTTFREGFRTEGFLTIYGQNAHDKAIRCGEIILERVEKQGYTLDRKLVETIGDQNGLEVVLRIAVADHRKEALEFFSKQIAPLVTSGPQGVSGYTTGRPKIRPIFGYHPDTIEMGKVEPKVEVWKSFH